MRSALTRKKWQAAWAVFLVGSFIAYRTNSDLGAWTLFATFWLGVACGLDVTDKKLNGPQ